MERSIRTAVVAAMIVPQMFRTILPEFLLVLLHQ